MLTSAGLLKIKVRAIRNRVWYRFLSKEERAILDLTIRCVEKIRSHVLVETIVHIISKVLKTIDDNFTKRAEGLGRSIAEKLFKVVEKWENKNVRMWRHDRNLIRFLGMNALNT